MYLLKSFQLFITCFIGCTIIILYVFEINNKHMNAELIKINKNGGEETTTINNNNKIKTIIAYSLQKQIEIEQKDMVDCHDKIQEFELKNVQMRIDRMIMATMASSTNKEDNGNNWIHVTDTKLYYYSAFYDDRLHQYPYVRIVAMIQDTVINDTYYCQLWNYKNQTLTPPIITKATINYIWSRNWSQDNDHHSYFNPILISCPTSNTTPNFISITKSPCTPTSTLKEIYNPPKPSYQNNFTICVKNLNYNTNKVADFLIEWLEIHRILGANKIYFYIENITNTIHKIINKYTNNNNNNLKVIKKIAPNHQIGKNNEGLLRYLNIGKNVSTSVMLWQKRRNYLVTYNDCFYRNIYTSRYVILVDLDEVIIPRFVDTWNQLESVFRNKKYASFMIQNAYFFSSLRKKSSQLVMLKNTFRTDYSPNGDSGKSFISTDNSLTVFNHYTFHTLMPGVSRTYFVPSYVAQLNHYREKCPVERLDVAMCKYFRENQVFDSVMKKYSQRLTDNVTKVKQSLRLIL